MRRYIVPVRPPTENGMVAGARITTQSTHYTTSHMRLPNAFVEDVCESQDDGYYELNGLPQQHASRSRRGEQAATATQPVPERRRTRSLGISPGQWRQWKQQQQHVAALIYGRHTLWTLMHSVASAGRRTMDDYYQDDDEDEDDDDDADDDEDY